ncbi:hypothetical protein L1887_17781 [Cichorium endivia]|nr:hypothetical protein L1887_17781 [Cichorium endivia]
MASILSLPDDILLNILTRLEACSYEDLFREKSSCKEFRALANESFGNEKLIAGEQGGEKGIDGEQGGEKGFGDEKLWMQTKGQQLTRSWLRDLWVPNITCKAGVDGSSRSSRSNAVKNQNDYESEGGWVARKPRQLGGISDALSIASDFGFSVRSPPSKV